MSHEITTTDGAAFSLKPAWHGLGVVCDHAMNSAEALDLAGLDWQVDQQPLYLFDDRRAEYETLGGHVANVRQDTGEFLGVVGETYKVLQNTEAFDFLDALHADGILKYESAFSIRGNRKVVILARVPGEWQVKGDDVLSPYLLFSNSHDGTEGVRFGATSVRVVCNNTYQFALSGKGREKIGVIRHTASMSERLDDARSMIDAAMGQFTDHVETAKALADRVISADEWATYIDAVCPLPTNELDPNNTPRKVAAIERTRSAIEDSYLNHETNRIGGIGSTAWAAYNAVSQHVDHLPRRGGNDRARAEARFNVTQYGAGQSHKTMALEAAKRLAGVE